MAEFPLSREEHRTLVRILAEKVGAGTPTERQVFLDGADLKSFRTRLDVATDARTFAGQLVRVLQDYGTLKETGHPALVSLLEALREETGSDTHTDSVFLDGLLSRVPGRAVQPGNGGPPPPPPRGSQIRLLFLAANPQVTDRLRLDEEMRTIKERLREAQALGRFDVESEWAVRQRDLRRAIMEYKPTLIHFSGHGEEGGAIVLEDRFGNPQPVPPEQLTDLFDIFRGRVQGIILNACWTKPQAEALVQQAGIPWVVGMERPVGDRAAIDFAAGFYSALGFGETVRVAYRMGRSELAEESPDERDTPQLLHGAGVDPDTIKFV